MESSRKDTPVIIPNRVVYGNFINDIKDNIDASLFRWFHHATKMRGRKGGICVEAVNKCWFASIIE